MKIQRSANAAWRGSFEEGKGLITTKSQVLNATEYSVASRFQEETLQQKTNPDELLAAAHASCYSLALTLYVQSEGYSVNEISTTASITIYTKDNSFAIEEITLRVQANIPNITREKFNELAEHAKFNCPVSKALAVVPIKVEIESFTS